MPSSDEVIVISLGLIAEQREFESVLANRLTVTPPLQASLLIDRLDSLRKLMGLGSAA